MKPRRVFVIFVAFWAVPAVQAREEHRKEVARYFGHFLPRHLNTCQTCHQVESPTKDEYDHNSFGARLHAVRKTVARKEGEAFIITRLRAVLDEDSDGDGVSNLLEILSGGNPGNPKTKPTPAEVEYARKTWAAFQPYPPWPMFQTVRRPAAPAVKNTGWVRNPIDTFLAAEHERRGLKPRPEALRLVLLRRVYLDLIGLPPTREEQQAALADNSADWYEKVVDRLLADPRHGERWGRHWMDVWRYADWAGYGAEVRESREHIWHWRDWIVESLNADKPYNRMVVEMLAGDEVAPADPQTLRATGFLVRQWYKFNRNTWLENTVEHTSKAFLGFTMNCARCHSHFFDTDVSHEDYYRFRAFFEPYDVRIDRLPGQPDLKKAGLPRAFDARPETPTYLFLRGNEAHPDKSKAILPGVPKALGGSEPKTEPIALPRDAYAPDRREFVLKETVAAGETEIAMARTALITSRRTMAEAAIWSVSQTGIAAALRIAQAQERHAMTEIDVPLAEARHAALLAILRAEALEEAGRKDSDEWKQAATAATVAQRKAAVLQARKNLLAAKPAQQGAAEKVLQTAEAEEKKPAHTGYTKRQAATYPRTSTGRRLALARWIADRQNPLTARVAMNHIWLRHFGSAIVPSVFDFGQNGQLPTHPALLDWLATEFMERGWSMRQMHRLIVTSSAYRMDSQTDQTNAALDRDNKYLWRMNVRRMEAEVVRDSVLYLAGQLDLTRGGPEIPYTQGLAVSRRSLYFQHAAEKQVEYLNLFDAANVNECYRRSESIIPQQALANANSTLVLAQSRRLAAKLTKVVGDPSSEPVNAAFVKTAFEEVLGRPPTVLELSECVKFLAEQAALLATRKLTPFGGGATCPVPASPVPHLRARENLVHVLMNHNDFVTIR